MGTKRTIAQLQAEADDLYGDYELDLGNGKILVLRPLLRLSEEKQNEVIALQGELDELIVGRQKSNNAVAALRAALHKMIRLVAATKAPADAFIKAYGTDLVLMLAMFNEYREATQLGEAASSSS